VGLGSGPVLVVGAGLSGLVAAYRLRQAGRRVVVAEAAGRLGGRLVNQRVAGLVVDGGGAWVGPAQARVLALVRELGLQTVPTFDRGRHLLRLNGRVRARRGQIPPLPAVAVIDLGLAVARLDRMARRRGIALDRRSVGAWIDASVRTHGARTVLRIGAATTTGRDPGEVSLLAFARHVHSAGGTVQLLGVRGAAQDSRIAGGAATMCERLAGLLGAGAIVLGRPVVAIGQSHGSVRVHFADGAGDVAAVVVAVDPASCRAIDFGPGLPPSRRLLQDRWVMGSGIKFHIAYQRPFWRDADMSGQYLADDGLARITFDATAGSDGPGILAGFIGEASTSDTAILEPTATGLRAARVAAELAQVFGPNAAHPIDYIEQDWRAVDYLAGCVPALPPGALTGLDAPALRCGKVWFAGAESAQTWEGHMDGAVRAGERAAAAVLAA